MTTWVGMSRTGRGPDSNSIQIAAGNELPAWNGANALTPPIQTVDSADEWIQSRWIATVAWLNRWPEAESGALSRFNPDDAPARAGSVEVLNVATVAMGHFGLETGWGANEWNWNLGGIHCPANGDVDCFREAASAGGEEFRSFDNFSAFADAYFTMVSRTPDYVPAWDAMKAGSANALLRLWRADYTCGGKTRTEATSLCTRVRRVVAAKITNAAASLPTVQQLTATEADVPNRCTPTSRNRGGAGGGSGGGSSSSRWWLLAAAAGAGLLLLNDNRRST